MGITGLIPFLKKASRPVNVKEFSGCIAAVDVYCWLHKGIFSCAEKIIRGEKTDGYVFYCIKMVNLLRGMNVTPILVFDGRRLPAKADVEKNRREQRERNRKKGAELLREGKQREAREFLKRAVDVTPEMALQVIQACHRLNVDCIVAPYEADAQLAYLSKSGIAQLIITEDSDLVLFGCEKILFKMDAGGFGVLVDQSRLHDCMGVKSENFSFEKFRRMCIMSGCDYLPSLPGIGLVKACKFFTSVKNTDLNIILRKIPSYLRMPQLNVTKKYIEDFIKAENTFLYQLAFDPRSRKLTPINQYPDGIDPSSMEYAGKYLPKDVAFQMALGNIDLYTMKTVDYFNPDKQEKKNSIWNVDFKLPKYNKNDDLKKIECFSTKGKEIIVEAKITSRKIQRKKDENENGMKDEDIIGLYDTSPIKKISKMNCDNVAEEISKASSEKFLNQILSSTSIEKTVNKTSPQEQIKKTVKSRFFSKPKSENTANKPQNWFDELASEYENEEKITSNSQINNIKNESIWTKIENVSVNNKLISTEKESDDSQNNNTVTTPKNTSNFTWKKLDSLSFNSVHSTPVSHTPFKSHQLSRKFSFNSSQTSELSELSTTNNSIDNESFDLTLSNHSSFPQSETNFSVDNEVNNSQISNKSLELSTQESEKEFDYEPKKFIHKSTPISIKAKKLGKCRQSGLSKKSNPKFKCDKSQISITDALTKFHYVKNKPKSLSLTNLGNNI